MAYTLAAPCSPSAAAIAGRVAADERRHVAQRASLGEQLERARGRRAVWIPVRIPRCSWCSSDDLQVLEERNDLGVSLSVVFDDLASGSRASALVTLAISDPHRPSRPG